MIALAPEEEELLRRLAEYEQDFGERLDAVLALDTFEDFIALMMPTYIRTPWTRLLCEHLEAVYRRDIQKLIVLAPPRHGKSEHCTVYWPAWVVGKEPGARFILTSYGDNVAWDFSRKARDVVANERYPFEARLRSNTKGAQQWKTTTGCEVNAAGLTGTITGKGASRLVFDDPTKNWEDAMSASAREANWNGYNAVLKTRVERIGKPPTVIIPAYRWHDDDLIGRILNAPDASEWTVLRAPALAEPTDEDPDPLGREAGEALSPEIGFTREILEKTRAEWLYGEGGTPAMWYAMYAQDPVPRLAAMFAPENWGFWSPEPHDQQKHLPRLVRVEHYIDTSFGEHQDSDFTAWATVGKGVDGNFYWLGMGRKRMKFNELVSYFEGLHQQDRRRPLVFEATHSAKSAIQFLRARGNRVVEWDHKNRDKVAIAEPMAEFQAMGRCFLPANYPREIVAAFVDEHARFPKSKWDDMTSTTCIALERLTKFTTRPPTGTYYVGSGWGHREAVVQDEIEKAWGSDPFGKWD